MVRDCVPQSPWPELRADGLFAAVRGLERECFAELSIGMTLAQGAKRCPYCVLITSGPPESSIGEMITNDLDEHEVRRAADGHTLLVSRCPGGPPRLLQLRAPIHDDRECEALACETSGVLIRADDGGRMSVFTPDAASYLQGQHMWTRPHMNGILEALTSAAPTANSATLQSLAHLAYWDISPAGVGATLISELTRATPDRAGFGGVPVESLRLNVNESAHRSGILHQVHYRDGAAVFDSHGTLRRAGVILVSSAAAVASVGPVTGGSRHHSAAWHSYDCPDVLCFVISRASHVTVFSGGRDVSPRALPIGAPERHT